MKRCRILFVLSSPVRAGVEEVVLSLLARLDRRSFEPALACPGSLLDTMAKELQSLNVETFQVQADSWFKLREVVKLASCIRSFRPDVVNPHLFRSALVAAPLAKWLGVPRVVETYHGREAWRQRGIKGSFAVDRIVSRWVDRVIAVSEAARDFLVNRKGISPGKITVVPNGRDLSAYLPRNGREARDVRSSLGIQNGAPVMGVVGRLEEQKGHRFLLSALSCVLPVFPDARLIVVGEGSLRDELEEQAQRLGVSSNVIFTGFRSDVGRLLSGMDVVVLPSLHEGMPLTAIEAAAMAKPIVATRVDGTPEVVEDGLTGLLVPPADPMALGKALVEIMRNPSEATRMGKLARQHALTRFDVSQQIKATEEVYKAAMSNED